MLEQLKEIISGYVDKDMDSVTEESRFVEDLGFNSYDFMCMVGDCEEAFDIQVDEREVTKIRTVGDALRYIASLQE